MDPRVGEAIELGIAVLDEALSVLEFAYQVDKPRGLQVTCDAIGNYLDTLFAAWVTPVDDALPAPSLAELENAGLALASQKTFEARLEEVSTRRRLLRALVGRNGWEWWQVEDTAQPN